MRRVTLPKSRHLLRDHQPTHCRPRPELAASVRERGHIARTRRSARSTRVRCVVLPKFRHLLGDRKLTLIGGCLGLAASVWEGGTSGANTSGQISDRSATGATFVTPAFTERLLDDRSRSQDQSLENIPSGRGDATLKHVGAYIVRGCSHVDFRGSRDRFKTAGSPPSEWRPVHLGAHPVWKRGCDAQTRQSGDLMGMHVNQVSEFQSSLQRFGMAVPRE